MRIVKEGWPFILGCLIASDIFLAGGIMLKSVVLVALAVLLFIATLFCVYFFRDPARSIPAGDRLFLSPADGKIMEIVEGKDSVSSGPVWIMRIFLSVFEPHLQRSPLAGRVKRIEYKKGKFLDARDPQAAFENEQNRIEIVPSPQALSPGRGEGEGSIVVTQIAGLIARRIVCWVKEGDTLMAGQKIGLIRFGSQVDVVLPKAANLRVKAGQHVTAGDTILAEL